MRAASIGNVAFLCPMDLQHGHRTVRMASRKSCSLVRSRDRRNARDAVREVTGQPVAHETARRHAGRIDA